MDYKELVKPYQPEAIKKLQEWIQINSVDDPSTSHVNQPFGKGVNEALKYIGELAKQKGFKVDYCDGYCTEISYGTKGKLI